jgi:hypothetical protein
MAAHTGMELYGRDGHAITIRDGAANDWSMAKTKPVRYGGNDSNGADDDALYGSAGNDAVYASIRDGLDMIVRYGIAYAQLWFRAIEQTTWSSRGSASTRP